MLRRKRILVFLTSLASAPLNPKGYTVCTGCPNNPTTGYKPRNDSCKAAVSAGDKQFFWQEDIIANIIDMEDKKLEVFGKWLEDCLSRHEGLWSQRALNFLETCKEFDQNKPVEETFKAFVEVLDKIKTMTPTTRDDLDSRAKDLSLAADYANKMYCPSVKRALSIAVMWNDYILNIPAAKKELLCLHPIAMHCGSKDAFRTYLEEKWTKSFYLPLELSWSDKKTLQNFTKNIKTFESSSDRTSALNLLLKAYDEDSSCWSKNNLVPLEMEFREALRNVEQCQCLLEYKSKSKLQAILLYYIFKKRGPEDLDGMRALEKLCSKYKPSDVEWSLVKDILLYLHSNNDLMQKIIAGAREDAAKGQEYVARCFAGVDVLLDHFKQYPADFEMMNTPANVEVKRRHSMTSLTKASRGGREKKRAKSTDRNLRGRITTAPTTAADLSMETFSSDSPSLKGNLIKSIDQTDNIITSALPKEGRVAFNSNVAYSLKESMVNHSIFPILKDYFTNGAPCNSGGEKTSIQRHFEQAKKEVGSYDVKSLDKLIQRLNQSMNLGVMPIASIKKLLNDLSATIQSFCRPVPEISNILSVIVDCIKEFVVLLNDDKTKTSNALLLLTFPFGVYNDHEESIEGRLYCRSLLKLIINCFNDKISVYDALAERGVLLKKYKTAIHMLEKEEQLYRLYKLITNLVKNHFPIKKPLKKILRCPFHRFRNRMSVLIEELEKQIDASKFKSLEEAHVAVLDKFLYYVKRRGGTEIFKST